MCAEIREGTGMRGQGRESRVVARKRSKKEKVMPYKMPVSWNQGDTLAATATVKVKEPRKPDAHVIVFGRSVETDLKTTNAKLSLLSPLPKIEAITDEVFKVGFALDQSVLEGNGLYCDIVSIVLAYATVPMHALPPLRERVRVKRNKMVHQTKNRNPIFHAHYGHEKTNVEDKLVFFVDPETLEVYCTGEMEAAALARRVRWWREETKTYNEQVEEVARCKGEFMERERKRVRRMAWTEGLGGPPMQPLLLINSKPE